jgi:hypothetical protein
MSSADLDFDDFAKSNRCFRYATNGAMALYTAGLASVSFGTKSYASTFLNGLASLIFVCGLFFNEKLERSVGWTSLWSLCLILNMFGFSSSREVRYDSRVYNTGGVALCILWFWAKRVRQLTATRAFWLVVYCFLFVIGVNVMVYTAVWHNVDTFLKVLPWVVWPPIIGIYRQEVFSLMSARFEGVQRLEDGAFMAALLDSVDATVGQAHWLHLDNAHKRKAYEPSDFRHNFRPGVVTKIEKNRGFWVQPERPEVPKFLPRLGSQRKLLAPLANNTVMPFVAGQDQEKAGSTALSYDLVWVPTTASVGVGELLENAKQALRCIEWRNVSLELFTTSPRDSDPATKKARQAQIYALSRPLKSSEGSVDLFVSHSWSDDGEWGRIGK